MADIIVSIQQFSITITATNLTNTATISSVSTTTSAIIQDGSTSTSTGDSTQAWAYLTLTNGTTITATRGASTDDITVKGVIVEYESSAIDSIQQGTILLDNVTSNTATISSVTTTRAGCYLTGHSTTQTTSTEANYLSNVELTNGTTVTAARSGNSSLVDTTVGYVVVEFDTTVINSVQQATVTVTAALSGTATITGVTTANTMLAWGGFLSASADGNCFARLDLTNTTTLTVNHADTASSTTKCSVIEFVSGVLSSVQRFATTIQNDVTSTTQTITSVATARSCLNYTGFSTGGDQPNEANISVVLTDATTVTLAKGATSGVSSDDGIAGYEVVEFATGASVETLTETATATDTFAVSRTGNAALSETSTATDSYTGGKYFSDTLSESATATESLAGTATGRGATSETATTTDALAGSATGNIAHSESASPADSNAGVMTGVISFSESATATDVFSSGTTYTETLTESATAIDSTAGSMTGNASLSESSTATDSFSSGTTYTEALTETATATDTHGCTMSGSGQTSETSSCTEGYGASATAIGSVSETVAANDNYDSSLNPAPDAVTIPQTGSGDELRRRKYLEWLRRQRKKRLAKERVRPKARPARKEEKVIELEGVGPPAAPVIAVDLPTASVIEALFYAAPAALEELVRNETWNTLRALSLRPAPPAAITMDSLLMELHNVREEEDEEAWMLLL